MIFHNISDQAGFLDEVETANKIGYPPFNRSFGDMGVLQLFVAADAADITTNGKLDLVRVKTVIAAGGVDLVFEEPTEIEPRWINMVCKKSRKSKKIDKDNDQ